MISFREYGDQQSTSSIISQATGRFVMDSSTILHWRLFRTYMSIYSQKDTSFITGKGWHNSVVIRKCVSFTASYIILSIPCVFGRRYVAHFSVCEKSATHLILYSSNLYPLLFHASGDHYIHSLYCKTLTHRCSTVCTADAVTHCRSTVRTRIL
jgi:hypothetical protein